MSVKSKNMVFSNIVKKEQLREVQANTLRNLKESLMLSAGPYGSTTGIIKDGAFTEYTKDGHTILDNIKYNRSIESSIQKELTELTRHIVVKVGDGTTSATILSSLIFDELCKLEDSYKIPPYKIIEIFKDAVSKIKELILKERRELTLDDIYKIAMICTNSNKEVSRNIADVYAEHGLDVYIDVGVSPNEETIIKSYDGLTIEEGYSDPVYINSNTGNKSDVGCATIRNARVYAFQDPIDTIEMTTLFTKIIYDNIITPYTKFTETRDENELGKMIPTVIMAPKISIDNSTIISDLVEFLYQFPVDSKPPILIISNIGTVHYEIYSDIWRLCGCKPIKKYIDPKIQERDIAEGKAPTPDTVSSFYGIADEVVSDVYKTSFINPKDMFITNDDGDRVYYSQQYQAQINFLESELKVAQEEDDMEGLYNIKRRLNSLKANMVDYLVGGVTTTDRDSVRALVEDAVKNIRSASNNGVGYGANYEGLRASKIVLDDLDEKQHDIVLAIYNAYREVSEMLYATAFGIDKAKELVGESVSDNKGPINLVTQEWDQDVLSTIDSDITILDVISKIITIMFTSNQMLVQTPAHNMYIDMNDII